jgi:hypothetical protein
MVHALRVCLGILGAAAVLIALSILITGAEATAAVGERTFDLLTRTSPPSSGRWPPSMDSELRFYAALWAAYGVVAIGCARNAAASLKWTPSLAAIFFLGGVGRLMSRLFEGPPHPFFSLLMWIELLDLLCSYCFGPRPGRER